MASDVVALAIGGKGLATRAAAGPYKALNLRMSVIPILRMSVLPTEGGFSVIGSELAGRVVAVGAEVTDLTDRAPGDGVIVDGSFEEDPARLSSLRSLQTVRSPA